MKSEKISHNKETVINNKKETLLDLLKLPNDSLPNILSFLPKNDLLYKNVYATSKNFYHAVKVLQSSRNISKTKHLCFPDKVSKKIFLDKEWVNAAIIFKDKYIVTGSFEKKNCRLWEKQENGEWRNKILLADKGVEKICALPDGRLAVVIDDGTVSILKQQRDDWREEENISLVPHFNQVVSITSIHAIANNRLVVSVISNNYGQVFLLSEDQDTDWQTKLIYQEEVNPSLYLFRMQGVVGGNDIVLLSSDDRVLVLQEDTAKHWGATEVGSSQNLFKDNVVISPDQSFFAYYSSDNILWIVEKSKEGQLKATVCNEIDSNNAELGILNFSPLGHLIVYFADGSMLCWQKQADGVWFANEIFSFDMVLEEDDYDALPAIGFLADGSIVCGFDNGQVFILSYDIETDYFNINDFFSFERERNAYFQQIFAFGNELFISYGSQGLLSFDMKPSFNFKMDFKKQGMFAESIAKRKRIDDEEQLQNEEPFSKRMRQ